MQLIAKLAVGMDPAGDDQHRDTAQKGLTDATGSMSHPSCWNDEHGANAVAGATNRIGHESTTAFMCDHDRPNLLGAVELIVKLGVVHPRNPEGKANSQLLQGKARQCGTCFLHHQSPVVRISCRWQSPGRRADR